MVDLFDDFRDGSKLLDLLEVMSDQCIVSPETHPNKKNIKCKCQRHLPVWSESGARKGNVPAQDQHRERPVVPPTQIGKHQSLLLSLEPGEKRLEESHLAVLSDQTGQHQHPRHHRWKAVHHLGPRVDHHPAVSRESKINKAVSCQRHLFTRRSSNFDADTKSCLSSIAQQGHSLGLGSQTGRRFENWTGKLVPI